MKQTAYVGRSSDEAFFTTDGREIWVSMRGENYVAVLSGKTFQETRRIKVSNGPGMTIFSLDGQLADVTVGGENQVKVLRTDDFTQMASISIGALPHGLWPSGDGSRVYVGLKNADAAAVIDTMQNTLIGTIPLGQRPQGVAYVPGAVPSGPGTDNLQPLGEAGDPVQLSLDAVKDCKIGTGVAT